MSPAKALRISVFAYWVLTIVGVALSFVLEERLPDPLRLWIAADDQAETSLSIPVIVLLMVAALSIGAGSIGLLYFRRWGAWLFAGSTAVGYILLPLLGPEVSHGAAHAVDSTAVIFSGIVIGLSFWTNVLNGNKREPNQAIQPTAPSRRG